MKGGHRPQPQSSVKKLVKKVKCGQKIKLKI
nr:MAG TPA: hypothetical protein [Caudoviricetes sp.]